MMQIPMVFEMEESLCMFPQAIRMADSAYKKYKTRDPYEIIDARHIKLWSFERPETLLGFYKVMSRKQYIGINRSADEVQKLTAVIHEVGHSLNDYKVASTGLNFEDNFSFFSMSAAPLEFNANLTGAELFIEDEYILNKIHYADYQRMVEYINSHIDRFRTARARVQFEEEQMRDFYDCHADLPSYEQLAYDLGIDVDLLKFKFTALRYKGMDMPNIPETQADFLRNWQR